MTLPESFNPATCKSSQDFEAGCKFLESNRDKGAVFKKLPSGAYVAVKPETKGKTETFQNICATFFKNNENYLSTPKGQQFISKLIQDPALKERFKKISRSTPFYTPPAAVASPSKPEAAIPKAAVITQNKPKTMPPFENIKAQILEVVGGKSTGEKFFKENPGAMVIALDILLMTNFPQDLGSNLGKFFNRLSEQMSNTHTVEFDIVPEETKTKLFEHLQKMKATRRQ